MRRIVLGSLRDRVEGEIAEHQRKNWALRSSRYPLWTRVLKLLYGERSLFGFLIPYVGIVSIIVVLEVLISDWWGIRIPAWSYDSTISSLLKDVTGYFLGAQAVMIGLLFPIAVGLVTLIVQREDASSTVSDVQVYYSETLTYRIGASGIALVMVLSTQLLWPAQFSIHMLGYGTPSDLFKIVLTSIHLFWLILNFAALWHFLLTSLRFMRPVERAYLRRRFAASVSIPNDLRERLSTALYLNLSTSLEGGIAKEPPGGTEPTLMFSPIAGEWGVVEVASPNLGRKKLIDVWTRPLGWAVRRWLKRTGAIVVDERHSMLGPTLIFCPELDRSLPEGGVICRRNGGASLSEVEKFVIRLSFRFGRAYP
ncbi:MAG: hypothetical protein R8L07_10460 [Alphaproteobacteria bacterium]|nr:hypothetical protein [Alphaproteobacteria bacterium]